MARMIKIKSEMYKGLLIQFVPLHRGFVGARVPSRTSQFIGIGKGKMRAFEDAKDSIDQFFKKERYYTKK